MIYASPLPFLPEPLDQLQARFTGALLRRWDFRTSPVGAANLPPFNRPHLHRAHVFDIAPGGIRIIIARTYSAAVPWYDPKPRDWIHATVTVHWDPPIDEQALSYLCQIHLDRISSGRLILPTTSSTPRGGPAELYFLPPSMTPGCILDDFPGERIRVCL